MFQIFVPSSHRLLRAAIAISFVLIVTVFGWNFAAYDLRASYVAGRLVANGQIAHIYDQTDHDSAQEDGSAWATAAQSGGIQDRKVPAYVQGPLWAWLIAPLAKYLGFAAFKRLFLALVAACTVGVVFSATRHWTPALATPQSQACVLVALFLTMPYFAGLQLGQTNLIYLFVVVQAMVAEQRGRSWRAGVLLALGAYTKISPMWIALTWLARGDWRATSSFVLSSACLLAATLLVGGWQDFHLFAHVLEKAGRFALLSFNNDSFASVLLNGGLNPQTAFGFQPVQMPAWLSGLSILATATSAIAMGIHDRHRQDRGFGPIFTLVAATAFTPLAWNHYFVVLVLPVILFIDFARRLQAARWFALAAIVMVLNVPPLSYVGGSGLWIVSLRSQFWAAMLCLLALPLLPRNSAVGDPVAEGSASVPLDPARA